MPRQLAELLSDHDVTRAARMGWAAIANGELIDAAETAGFALLLTGDRSIRYQQNLSQRQIALVVLSSNNWNHLHACPDLIVSAVRRASRGSYEEVTIPRPGLIRRPWPPNISQ